MSQTSVNKAALAYYVRSALRSIGQNVDVRETDEGVAVLELDFFVKQSGSVLNVFSGVTSLESGREGANAVYKEELIASVPVDDLPIVARAIAINMATFIIDSSVQAAFDTLHDFRVRTGREIQTIDDIG